MGWNFGDVLDAVEPVLPSEAPAFIHGARVVTWGEAKRITNNLAHGLIARGSKPGDKLAIYMRNRPEYLLALSAAFKARLTHVNVNYRYTPQEVWYIFDNSDAQTVVYSSEFRHAVAEIRPRLPKVKTWIEVSSDGRVAPFAEAFDGIASQGNGEPLDVARSGEDQIFVYTGGTTGMPKGVMWSHQELRAVWLRAGPRLRKGPETPAELAMQISHAGPGTRTLSAPPLMHGTGLITAMGVMLAGGSVVTLEGDTFNAISLLEAVEKWRPSSLTIVGDSFGKPILDALNESPGRFDVSSIASINSSGVMWSLDVKRGLLEHMPNAALTDGFSSSEAIGMGASLMKKGSEIETARFSISDRCRVIDEFDRMVVPGSGLPGMLAIGPPNPLGYYKDEEKSARTFRVVDGVRYSIPGDWCLVEADGTLTLLGRGNMCINTAGEKVFPEEVEEVLKTHPSIEDALVIGQPDEKWGQAVTAVVRLEPGHVFDEVELRAHARHALAGFKVPKRIFLSDLSLRSPNGKPDYEAARNAAEAATALRDPVASKGSHPSFNPQRAG